MKSKALILKQDDWYDLFVNRLWIEDGHSVPAFTYEWLINDQHVTTLVHEYLMDNVSYYKKLLSEYWEDWDEHSGAFQFRRLNPVELSEGVWRSFGL